jgi:chromosome segregation ATPase
MENYEVECVEELKKMRDGNLQPTSGELKNLIVETLQYIVEIEDENYEKQQSIENLEAQNMEKERKIEQLEEELEDRNLDLEDELNAVQKELEDLKHKIKEEENWRELERQKQVLAWNEEV